MARQYTLGRKAAEQVARTVRHAERAGPSSSRPPVGAPRTLIYIARTGASGVPARSGLTPGTAAVTLYRIGSTGDLESLTHADGSGITVTAHNIATSLVAANAYIQLKQESISGKYIVDFEDCG